jgi:hypothetical protein
VPEETIPDQDAVSRLLFEPSMRREDKDLFWENIFQFPSDQGQVESVIWRAKVVPISGVHALGCAKQASDRTKGKNNSAYFGAMTGNVGAIRALRSPTGKFFTVKHVPTEGEEHSHIGFSEGASKNDRNGLKFQLRWVFGALEPHACA